MNEIWIYDMTEYVYLLTLVIVFSLSTYLFIRSRKEQEYFELNSLEQRAYLHAISTYTRNALVVLDQKGSVRFANQQFLKLFDRTPSGLEGEMIENARLPEDLIRCIRSEGQSCTISDDRDGRQERQVYKHPILTEESRMIGQLVLIGSSELVQKVEESDTGEVILEKVSHNLKTPLNAIIGYSRLLEEDIQLNRKQQKYLNTITENCTLLLHRVNDLLKPDQQESGWVGNEKKSEEIRYILVVDDVAINRTLLRIVLEKRGFEVTEARNGKEALDRIAERLPDLVLMDITMPVMDGLEALNRIRSASPPVSELRVVAVTANSRRGNRKRMMENGFDGYIQKPFSENELMTVVRSGHTSEVVVT